jgi:hypothetical protein
VLFSYEETPAEWLADASKFSSDKPLTGRMVEDEELGMVGLKDDAEEGIALTCLLPILPPL